MKILIKVGIVEKSINIVISIEKIANTYHNWRNPDGHYEDVKGFCKSATIEEVRELDYVPVSYTHSDAADE